MWQLKKTAAPFAPAPPPAAHAPDEINQHQALDTLAAVIRTLGRHAPQAPELEPLRFAEKCEAWAAHLLSLTAPPGAAPVSQPRRDWEGVRRFIKEARVAEQRLVHKAVGDLRQVVTAFVQAVNRTFQEDEESDKQVLAEMEALCSQLEGTTTEELKQRAVQVAQSLASAIERRRARHNQQMEELGHQVDTLGTRLTEAERESAQDPLTQLYNRRVLDAALSEAVALRRSYGHQATLLILDVDHFKKVNDRHGHPAGDAVLKALANTLVRCFPRRSDVVTRFGGEEFAVLLSDTGQQDAGVAVRRVMDAVRGMVVRHQELELGITVSIGVAEVHPELTPTDWLELADVCLYQAKEQGRDRAVMAPAPPR